MSRKTRSASAASGTFSTYEVWILSPNSFSIAFLALSCANVQPPSPTGPTYANAIFSGPLAVAVADAPPAVVVDVVVVVVVAAGVAVVVVVDFSSLLQP